MFGMCDRRGMPHLFVSISPDYECSFHVQLWVGAGNQFSLPSLDSLDSVCINDYVIRRET